MSEIRERAERIRTFCAKRRIDFGYKCCHKCPMYAECNQLLLVMPDNLASMPVAWSSEIIDEIEQYIQEG